MQVGKKGGRKGTGNRARNNRSSNQEAPSNSQVLGGQLMDHFTLNRYARAVDAAKEDVQDERIAMNEASKDQSNL